MLNHLCRGHFLIRHHQMSELAGQNLHLDLQLWQPGQRPSAPLATGEAPLRQKARCGLGHPPFPGFPPFKGGRNIPPVSAPSLAALNTQPWGSALW